MIDTIAKTYLAKKFLQEHVVADDSGGVLTLAPSNPVHQKYEGTVNSLRGNEPYSPEAETKQIKNSLSNPQHNKILVVANQYSKSNFGHEISLDHSTFPQSSLRKQYAIAKAYDLAASKNPEYERGVYTDYAKNMSSHLRNQGIHDYPSLVSAAYTNAAKETKDQFNLLPLKVQLHLGNLGYHNSNEMLRDIHLHGNVTVYRGGNRHEFFHHVDPRTGINENEMFRAVHDVFGHAIHGNQFGAKGEEIAYHAHNQMYSPLARIAVASETRGQNSNVNYTTKNLHTQQELENLREKFNNHINSGDISGANQVSQQLRSVGEKWKYAKQASVALPHSMLSSSYTGEIPDYMKPLLRDKKSVSNPIYDVDTDHLGLAALAIHHNTGSHLNLHQSKRGVLDTQATNSDLAHLASVHGFSGISREVK